MADNNLVLIAVGPDRVGLVEKISEFISGKKANIEDSRMAVFAGEFAAIFLLTGEPQGLLEIARTSNDLSIQTGLNVWVKQASPRKAQELSTSCTLVASCMDHPGIVYKISTALSKLGINIETMETKTSQAPESGDPVFRMEAEISVPSSVSMESLRERLAVIEREENIDLDLTT